MAIERARVVPDAHPKCAFELVPFLELPLVDLGPSVKSRLPQYRLLHAVLHILMRSRFTFVFYLASVVSTVIMFFLPVSVGQVIALLSLVLGLPGATIGLVTLRYEMVTTLVATYDIWFFGVVSTVVNGVLAVLLHDVRAFALLICWLSFFVNIFVDASVVGIRVVWLSNVVSAIGFFVAAAAIGIGMTAGLHTVDVVHINGHVLPATSLARDGFLTIAVVVSRNMVRRFPTFLASYRHKRSGLDSMIQVMHCVSFRYRLQVRSVAPYPEEQRQSPAPTSATCTFKHNAKIRLRYLPLMPPFDHRHTMLPGRVVEWFSTPWSHLPPPAIGWCRRMFLVIGVVGLGMDLTAFMLVIPRPGHDTDPWINTVARVGLAFTVLFTSVSLALRQRQLLRALVTSFDFVYIMAQITVLHFTVADLTWWRAPITMALVGTWCWSLWLLCFDALMPHTRRQLGLPARIAAWVCTALVLLTAATAATMFLLLPPNALNDRVLVAFAIRHSIIEVRALSLYFTCAFIIGSWTLRLLWRLWRAVDGELCVLDGPVAIDYSPPSRKSRAGGEVSVHAIVPVRT